MRLNKLLPLALLLLLGGCRTGSLATERSSTLHAEPRAEARPHRLVTHGKVRTDEFYWLREREDPDVLAYLEAENEHLRVTMAHTEALQEELYQEMVARVRQDDSTVPQRIGAWSYYTRFVEGEQYPLYCRTQDAGEEVLLDVNAMAAGHAGYYSVTSPDPSPKGDRIAYGIDTRGRRIYALEVKDLASGRVTDRIEGVTSNTAWAEDERTLFYARQDPETLRTYQIWRHVLGTEPAQDFLVYQEDDETFSCSVSKTRSRRFLMIASSQTLATEYRTLAADDPLGDFTVFLPRERGHEYRLGHHGEYFYILTNSEAQNFRLMRTPVGETAREQWTEVVAHRPDVLLEGIELFRDHMVLIERRAGLVHLRVRDLGTGLEHEIPFDEPAYSARPRSNDEFDTPLLRYGYSSLTTPDSVYDYDMDTRQRVLRKRQEVFGGFDPADYVTVKLQAKARDGALVPISVVYKQPAPKGRPLLLYGYGSYGNSLDARFDPNVLSLLDRGFVYAIAHVRGGEELGRGWYEDGKLLKKKNTFTDFIACAEHLVAAGMTSPEHLYALGGSAGGLLMGAVANMRPELFRGIVANVPFVDVVTTMLDASIPLTTFEYDEWGNPNDPLYYEYMLSYSPYDQVRAQGYPNLLVTTGLHDSQVQYWEPAKWVARLRALRTDKNRLLMKCDMEAGHGGASGRYKRYRDRALIYAFLLDTEKE